jgi:hypothetical protein
MKMDKQISNGLKYLFLFHCIVGVVFGLTYLFGPDTYATMVDWPLKETLPYRLVGAALMGFGVSSWFAFRSTLWESVKIVVIMEIVWCGCGTAVMLWGVFTQGLPGIAWMNVGLMAFFTVAFGYFLIGGK